jgi:GAF domain-containing protein
MEPIPQTRAVLDQLSAVGDADLAAELTNAARRVCEVVPQCVGVSLSQLRAGLTFTLVATHARIAAIDGAQYLDGGPCVSAALLDERVEVPDLDLLDEARWAVYARAGAAAGVASSLSLPIRDAGEVTGSVNLYASTPDAFAGHSEELAAIFGAWAPGAVSNADVCFRTRLEAAAAPARLAEFDLVNQAVGMVAAAQGVDPGSARQRLRDAAARAGLSEVQIAGAVVQSLRT